MDVAPHSKPYGENFAAFILKHKLGAVVGTGFAVNPNTNNPLQTWVWTVDHAALAAWKKTYMKGAK